MTPVGHILSCGASVVKKRGERKNPLPSWSVSSTVACHESSSMLIDISSCENIHDMTWKGLDQTLFFQVNEMHAFAETRLFYCIVCMFSFIVK